MKANPSSFLQPKVLTGVVIEKERKCYSICIFSTRFQTPWKENHLCNPPPFLKTLLPLRISVILHWGGGGEGYFLEPHIPSRNHFHAFSHLDIELTKYLAFWHHHCHDLTKMGGIQLSASEDIHLFFCGARCILKIFKYSQKWCGNSA